MTPANVITANDAVKISVGARGDVSVDGKLGIDGESLKDIKKTTENTRNIADTPKTMDTDDTDEVDIVRSPFRPSKHIRSNHTSSVIKTVSHIRLMRTN